LRTTNLEDAHYALFSSFLLVSPS